MQTQIPEAQSDQDLHCLLFTNLKQQLPAPIEESDSSVVRSLVEVLGTIPAASQEGS